MQRLTTTIRATALKTPRRPRAVAVALTSAVLLALAATPAQAEANFGQVSGGDAAQHATGAGNGNGIVDAADLVVWRKNDSAAQNGNGIVDYIIWRDSLGNN